MVKKMENETMHIDSPHSVKISINAKGQWSGEVKCYGNTPEEAKNRTLSLATEIESLIRQKNG